MIVRSYPSKDWQGKNTPRFLRLKFPKYRGKVAAVEATKSKVEFSHFIVQRSARLVSYDLLFGTKLNLKTGLPATKLQDCWIINRTGNLWISAIVEVSSPPPSPRTQATLLNIYINSILIQGHC